MARDLPSLNAVRMFETVARELSFTRAAERLHVTQGAVSRQIRQLEDELGQALFRRRGRRLELTDAGKQYREFVEDGLRMIRRGTARIRERGSAPRLSLTVLPSFAARWLIPRLHGFQEQHSELEIWLGTSYDTIDFESDTDVDAGIRFGRGHWPDVHVEPLVVERVSPVCTPDIAERLDEPRDVLKFKLFGDKPPWDEWQPWLEAHGVESVGWEPGLSNDFSVILQAAVEGQGVAMARDLLVADDLIAGRLVRPFPAGVRSQFNYYFVCSRRRADDAHLQSFVAWLRTAMQETLDAAWS